MGGNSSGTHTLLGNGAPHPLRVLIVDEHAALTDGLRSILRHPGIEVVGVVRTAEQAFSAVGAQVPDVVLLVWAKSTLAGTHNGADPDMHAASPRGGNGSVVPEPPLNGNGHKSEQNHAALVGYLTPRERQILDLLSDGASNKEIAKRLCIRSNTVRTHVQNVLTKLRVHNRLGAVTLAMREGLATPAAQRLMED